MKSAEYPDGSQLSCFSNFEILGLFLCLLLSKRIFSYQFFVVVSKNILLTLEAFCYLPAFFQTHTNVPNFCHSVFYRACKWGYCQAQSSTNKTKTFPRQKLLLLWDNRLLTEDSEASTTHSLSKPEAFRITKKAFYLKFCQRLLASDSSLWYPSLLWFTRTIFLKSIVWSPGIHFGELRWILLDKRPKNWPLSSKTMKIFLLW